MAKPSQVVSWATNASTRVEPTSGEKAAGFAYGDKPPSRWLNWLYGLAGDWTSYLNNLHNEPEYLNKTYAWTGEHQYTGTAQLTYAPARLMTRAAFMENQLWWFRDSGGLSNLAVQCGNPNKNGYVELPMPVGATLKQVRIVWRQGAAHTVVPLTMFIGTVSHVPGAANTWTTAYTQTFGGTINAITTTTVNLSLYCDYFQRVVVDVLSSDSANAFTIIGTNVDDVFSIGYAYEVTRVVDNL